MEVAPARRPPTAPTLPPGALVEPRHTLPWWVRVPRRWWLSVVKRVASPTCDRFAARVPALRLAAERLCTRAHRTELEVCGAPFRVDLLRRCASRSEFLGGRWHAPVLALVRACVAPGMTTVDVGAGIGLVAVHMGEVAGPEGTVLAIEPEARNQEILAFNARHCRWRNVVPIHTAVGDHVGESSLWVSPRDGGDHRTVAGVEDRVRVTVPLTTIDELADARRTQVHFARIAAQGAELSILRGMRTTLSHPAFRGVVIQLWPHALRAAGEDPEELLDRLRTAGLLCANARDADADPATFLASIPGSAAKDLVYLRG